MSYRVPVEGGKYVFKTLDGYSGVSIERSGSEWCTIEWGAKAVVAMMGELEEARKLAAEPAACPVCQSSVESRQSEKGELEEARKDLPRVSAAGTVSLTLTNTAPRVDVPPTAACYLAMLENVDRYRQQVGDTLRRQMSELVAQCESLGVAGDPPLAPLDTFNWAGVTGHCDKVAVLLFIPRIMSKREALQLAAWLIVGAEMAGEPSAKQLAMATVAAIEAT